MRTRPSGLRRGLVACVWALTALPEAVQAATKSLRRARRAREATPFITLPQSLLLQSSGGENHKEEQALTDAQASAAVKAAAGRGGYGNQLWSEVQESAGELVQDAREAFFAETLKADAPFTVTAGKNEIKGNPAGQYFVFKKPANFVMGKNVTVLQCRGGVQMWKGVVITFASDSGDGMDTAGNRVTGAAKDQWKVGDVVTTEAQCPAPVTTVTTTIAVTTVDPAVLAKQLKITQDAAKARNLLIGMIERSQISLLNRLQDIGLDLEATEARAKLDLQAVNHSFTEAKNMPITAQNAEVDVKKIDTNGDKLKVTIPDIERRASTRSTEIGQLMRAKKQSETDLSNSKKLPGAKRRIETNQQTLNAVVPRLERLEKRVTKLEAKLYDGDLNKMVDDTSTKEVMNIMEDVSRGFGRFIANAGN